MMNFITNPFDVYLSIAFIQIQFPFTSFLIVNPITSRSIRFSSHIYSESIALSHIRTVNTRESLTRMAKGGVFQKPPLESKILENPYS